jgi:hypothetical protein
LVVAGSSRHERKGAEILPITNFVFTTHKVKIISFDQPHKPLSGVSLVSSTKTGYLFY